MAEASAKAERLRKLSSWQWRVLLTSPLVLLGTWLQLHRRGFRATLAGARPVRPSGLEEAAQHAVARDTAYALAVAVKYGPWRPRCLLRSLALARLLARKGIPCEIRIGLPAGRPFSIGHGRTDHSAHAWVECGGAVLNDRADIAGEFEVFDQPFGRV